LTKFIALRGGGRRASTTRRRARQYRSVAIEDLEGRRMLTAGPVGMNLGSSLQYVDLMKESGDWSRAGSTTLTEDAKGWPTSDATILVLDWRVNQPWNGPDPNAVSPDIGGTYHLSFHGRATVVSPSLYGRLSVQNQSYNATSNTTTADVVVPHNVNPFLDLTFTSTVNPASATGAGVTDVQLIRPGYAAGTTQLFTNDFLNALKPFGTLRYLNVDAANAYGATLGANNLLAPLNWSQRTLPDARTQASPSNASPGQAWENIIALANATGTDMWINIPGPATDDYVTQLARLIQNGDTVDGARYAGLAPNLKVYVEYSNEVWGGIYNPYAYNTEAAKEEVAAGGSKLNNDGDTNLNDLAGRRYLERTMQVATLFRGVIGADPSYSRIRPVLGWQETNVSYYTQTFPWFESAYGAPSSFFHGMGNANYWSPGDYSSVDNIINSLAASEASTAATTAQFTTVAAYYGLKNVAYEGGPAIGNDGNQAAGRNALAASRDPRMEGLVKQHYLDWYAAGGDVANYFDGPYDTWSPQNEWSAAELAQASNPGLSPKYRGIVDVASAPLPAVTAGVAVTASTGIPLGADGLGQGFTTPKTGQFNLWLLNVATAGTYNIAMTTAGGGGGASQPGSIQLLSGDKAVLGTYSVAASGSYNLGSITLRAGLNTLAIRTIRGSNDPASSNPNLYAFRPSSLTLTAAAPPPSAGPAAGDAGFEAVAVGSGSFGSFAYDPAGSAWAFAGQAGVSGNSSGFTGGNPAAPQGGQVGFLQAAGSFSQGIAGWAAGSYQVGFLAAQRGNNGPSAEDFQVLIDGVTVSTFRPAGTAYSAYSTASFSVAAGTHTVTFKGLDSAGGDNTAFIDAVAVTRISGG